MADKTERAVLAGAAGLITLGVLLATRPPSGTKRPGDTLKAAISFHHQGSAQTIWVGFGLRQTVRLGANPITNWAYEEADIPVDAPPGNDYMTEVSMEIPDLPAGKYDVFVFLQQAGGPLNPDGEDFLKSKLYPKQLTIV